MDKNTLRDIFYQHDGRLIHKWDQYFDIYEHYFEKYKGKEINILEIGISHGGSIQLWRKYFGEKINLFAIDFNPECQQFEDDRTKVFIGSQTDTQFLDRVISTLPVMDVIIDDGGHTMQQQIVSFEKLFMTLKEGGLYLVEDTHTSYWHAFHGGLRKKGSFIEYAKDRIDSLYDEHVDDKSQIIISEITENINSIAFYDSVVVFEKKKRNKPFHIQKGTETINPYVAATELKKATLWMKLKAKFFGTNNNSFWNNHKGKIS